MARPHAAEQLPYEEFSFLIDCIVNHKTNRAIEGLFQEKFNKKLSKSAIARWRDVAGDEMANAFMLTRYQAEQLLKDVKKEGGDKFEIVLENIEDQLLTAMAKGISQDPIKLLGIQQEEKKRQLKERELQLKERAQTFTEEQAKSSNQLQQDRLQIASDVWRITLAYFLKADPPSADLLTKHSDGILNAIEEGLEAQAT